MESLSVKIKKIFSSQLGGGISWNMVSLGFMAAGGLLYNFIIMIAYGSATLGVFNLAFAYYAAMSQIAVCGIHFSTLKYISQYHDNKEKVAKIFGSALLAASMIAFTISIIVFILLIVLQNFIFDEIITYMLYIVPALFLFAINKVILNYINGLAKMKEYAVFQSLRNVYIIIAFIIFAIFKIPAKMLTLCFGITEFLLLISMIIYAVKSNYIKLSIERKWIIEHIRFGIKIMPGSLVLELNARMDVIILAIFTGDVTVGIYSFALRFAEGFYQVLVVIRRNINPYIARHIAGKKINALNKLNKSVTKYSKYLVPTGGIIITVGFILLCLILGQTHNYEALIPLVIVMVSITINSTYIIFGNTLNQGGFPASEARLNIATLMTNVILNFLLIPYLGIYGAAIATAISYIIFSVILYYSSKRNIGFRIHIL